MHLCRQYQAPTHVTRAVRHRHSAACLLLQYATVGRTAVADSTATLSPMNNRWLLSLLVSCRHSHTPVAPARACNKGNQHQAHSITWMSLALPQLGTVIRTAKQTYQPCEAMSRSPLALCARQQVCEYRANTKGGCHTGLSQPFKVPSPTHPFTPVLTLKAAGPGRCRSARCRGQPPKQRASAGARPRPRARAHSCRISAVSVSALLAPPVNRQRGSSAPHSRPRAHSCRISAVSVSALLAPPGGRQQNRTRPQRSAPFARSAAATSARPGAPLGAGTA